MWDVDGMLRGMTAEQFGWWLAYAGLDPIGEERGDLRAGIVASVIANVNRSKGSKGFTPKDFMPEFGEVAAASARRRAPLTDITAFRKLTQSAKAMAGAVA